MAVVFVAVVVVVDWAIQRCKGEGKPAECNRSPCHTAPFLLLLIHSHPKFIYLFSPARGLQTTPPPDLKLCGRAQTKRRAGRVADSQHQTSYGVRHSGIRNTAPRPPQSPFSSLDIANARSRLADTHQLRYTPTLIPPEKEGVPIVRISV